MEFTATHQDDQTVITGVIRGVQYTLICGKDVTVYSNRLAYGGRRQQTAPRLFPDLAAVESAIKSLRGVSAALALTAADRIH